MKNNFDLKNHFNVNADRTQIVALANSAEPEAFPALENAVSEIDDDGWCLIAPFGRWPKNYNYVDGSVAKQKKFIQALDNESADALVSKENSFFGKLKRAIVGVPVYKLHGDVKDVDPKSLANSVEKLKVGVVDQIRKSTRGIEARFALDNDGADAVKAGYKFPSAYWWVLPVGLENDSIVARPFKLISVALTQFPNISGVESLANDRGGSAAIPSAEEKNKIKKTDMKKLAGWLMAMGATSLANAADPTEDQVLEGMKSVLTSKAGEVTALANEKSTLTSTTQVFRRKASILVVDLALFGGRLLPAERDAKITALENAKDFDADMAVILGGTVVAKVTALENDLSAARKERAGLVVDLVIQKGKLAVADRAVKITALENATDEATFQAESKKLMEAATVVKTGADSSSTKEAAALDNESTALANDYQKALGVELAKTDQNISEAHRRIMTLPEYTGLAQRLTQAKKA